MLAAQVLEPIYEIRRRVGPGGRGLRGDGQATPTIRRARSSCYSTIAEIEERRLSHQNAAFDAYGRALHADPDQRRRDRPPRTAGAEHRTGRAGASVYEPELDEDRRQPAQVRACCCAWPASTRRRLREADEAIAIYRQRDRRRARSAEALAALDRLYSRGKQLGRAGRRRAARDPARRPATSRRSQLTVPPGADLRAGAGGSARGRRGLSRDPGRRPAHPETRTALERMFMGGTMQHRDRRGARAALQAGEEWEKLQQIYEVQLGRMTDLAERQSAVAAAGRDRRAQAGRSGRGASDGGREAVKEDPSSEQALDELLRLARATHQWDAYVGTMIDAAQNADRPGRAARRAAAPGGQFEADLGDLERAEEVLVQVLTEHPTDVAALASLDRIYDRQGITRSWRRCCASGSRSPTTPGADQPAPAAGPRLRRRAGRPDGRDRRLPGGAGARHPQRRGAGGARAPVLPQRALDGPLRHLREAGRRRHRRRRRMADCYARMAKLAADALDDRDQGRRAVGQGPRPARRGRHRAGGAGRPARAGRRVARADRGAGQAVTATADRRADRIPIYKRLGRIWGEKLRASATRWRAGRRSWRSIRRTSTPCAPSPRTTAAPGAWEELSRGPAAPDRGRPAGRQRHRADELKELYSQLGELEGDTLMRTDRTPSMPGARCWSWTPADFRALAALETLFMQEARWEEAVDILERRATRPGQPRRTRSTS